MPNSIKGKRKSSALMKIMSGLGKPKMNTGKPKVRSVPVAYSWSNKQRPYRVESRGNDAIVSGSDWSQQVLLRTANDKTGAVVVDINLNPFTMSTTRLSKMAALYEFWEIIQLKFTYSGGEPTSTPGQFTGFIDYDVNDDLTSTSISTRNLEIAAAHKDTVRNVKLYDRQTWIWKDPGNVRFKKMFTNPTTDAVNSSAGRFYLITNTTAGVTGDTTVGTLSVEYKIRFHKPQLDDTLYGYASKWNSGGVMTAAAAFGSIPVCSWSNLPFAKDPLNGVVTFYPGNYLFISYITGTVITVAAANFAPAVTKYQDIALIDAAATHVIIIQQFSSTTQTQMTIALTATTVTAGIHSFCSLPVDAVSMTSTLTKAMGVTKELIARMFELKKTLKNSDISTEISVDDPTREIEEEEKKNEVIVVNTTPVKPTIMMPTRKHG